ncbi:MAG: NTP transferase domain-containing protein [Synergistaceae bacterium]|nr:NTP transferase domain-containing protein [Synergistaceae bacterium]MBR0247519.1 NTP transferase domain-containing protein [Synergistaceae bacterium]
MNYLRGLSEKNYINVLADGGIEISEKGLKALGPYRVRKAIILATGFGQRLAPVTLDTPKPLVKVNGVRIIDTLLDALVAKGITNITIVRGYKEGAVRPASREISENPLY